MDNFYCDNSWNWTKLIIQVFLCQLHSLNRIQSSKIVTSEGFSQYNYCLGRDTDSSCFLFPLLSRVLYTLQFFCRGKNTVSGVTLKIHFYKFLGMVPRWWRNKTGSTFSPPQIHQKIIWMMSKFHKATLNAGRCHQAPRKAAHSFWKEVGQNIKDRKRDKRFMVGGLPCRGSCEWEVSTQ